MISNLNFQHQLGAPRLRIVNFINYQSLVQLKSLFSQPI